MEFGGRVGADPAVRLRRQLLEDRAGDEQIITIGVVAVSWAGTDAYVRAISLDTLFSQVSQGMQSVELVAALLWTGLITTALTFFLEVTALGELSSAETTVLFATEPLWGAAFAYIALNEHVGPETFAG
ncbi:hypothetical protein T484DRAFT_1887859, partial [Baffinella frigidus]